MKFKKKYVDGILFFEFSEPFPKMFSEEYYYYHKDIGETSNRLLALIGLQPDNNRLLILGTTDGFYENRMNFLEYSYEGTTTYTNCSSYLTEKDKAYTVDNLSESVMDTPWVEGVPGDGIGEGFTLTFNGGSVDPTLLLMNGYISFDKPYLYEQNNRIKKIKVKGLTSGREKILDVIDTPHPQTVDISFITEMEDIRVEIAEVYKGTKYDDTCLQYCSTFMETVIPYKSGKAD